MQRELTENGFIHLKNFFPKEDVHRVLTDAKNVFLIQLERNGLMPKDPASEEAFAQSMFKYFETDKKGFIACGKVCQHLVSLHRFSLQNRMIDALKTAGLEFPVICARPVMYFNSRHLAESQGYWKSPPHQDWRSMQGSLNSLVMWVPMVDIDLRLGALEIYPRSHKLGLLESEPDDWYRTIPEKLLSEIPVTPVETKVGDGLLFSSFLAHRSGNNVTDRIRWSCHFRFNDVYEQTFIDRKYPHPYIYKPQQELMTPDFPTPELIISALNKSGDRVIK